MSLHWCGYTLISHHSHSQCLVLLPVACSTLIPNTPVRISQTYYQYYLSVSLILFLILFSSLICVAATFPSCINPFLCFLFWHNVTEDAPSLIFKQLFKQQPAERSHTYTYKKSEGQWLPEKATSAQRGRKDTNSLLSVSGAGWKWSSTRQTSLSNTDNPIKLNNG